MLLKRLWTTTKPGPQTPLFCESKIARLAVSQPGLYPVNGAPVSELKSLHSSVPPLLFLLIECGHVWTLSAICVPCCSGPSLTHTCTQTHTRNKAVSGWLGCQSRPGQTEGRDRQLEIHSTLQNAPGVTVCLKKVTHPQCVYVWVCLTELCFLPPPTSLVLGFGCRQTAAAELRFLLNYVIGPN